jgi:gallate dioxygenase
MAKIIGGIGASHAPTIGFAKDHKSKDDPDWADVFKVFEPVKAWLKEKNPDVLLLIYNDHITSFFLDHYSPFVLGVDDSYQTADEPTKAVAPVNTRPSGVTPNSRGISDIPFSPTSSTFHFFRKSPLIMDCFRRCR